ncbi:hypothetical protein BGZ94_008119 [Podila epigama]|nr:hypothetical protein BGZ94_008119 [Podila epigama]
MNHPTPGQTTAHIPSYGSTPRPTSGRGNSQSNDDTIRNNHRGYENESSDDDDDDDNTEGNDSNDAIIAAKGKSTWRSWYRSLIKFFRGLGKFFLIVALGTVVLVLVLQYTLPSVDEEQRKNLHFPHSLEDLEALRKILSVYMDKHYYRVMVGFLTVYLYLQTFSVPGSMWLSILGGALFKFWIALAMVSFASAVGATNCYLLSQHFFSKLVRRKFGDRMDKWNTQLERHRNNLLSYIILLRLAPFPPNWFTNICAPHLHVPLWPEFFLGTLIGVTAPSVVHIQAGSVLEKLVEDHSSGVSIFTLKNILMLGAVALLATLPVVIRWALARHEARKVGIVVGSEDEERAGLLAGQLGIETRESTTDPILEPLDPTGVIIPVESQHFHRPRSQRTLSTPAQNST